MTRTGVRSSLQKPGQHVNGNATFRHTGTALLAVYALGLGIPFLLAAIFINRAIRLMNRIKPWLRVIERVMGALLLVVGVMLLTGAFSAFSYWLLETFPGLAMLG